MGQVGTETGSKRVTTRFMRQLDPVTGLFRHRFWVIMTQTWVTPNESGLNSDLVASSVPVR